MTRIRFLEHFGHDGGIRQSAGAKLAASREDKVAILSDARAVTPTDAATAKNEAADDGSVMSSQSVFSCQTLPTELYREVLKAHSCKGVIAPQFAITFPILGAVPYRGPLQAAGGAAHEVRLRRDEARGFDAHYRPECCSGGDDDQKPPAPKPKPQPKPKPTNRPRKEAGGSGKGEADDDKKAPKPKSQSKDTTTGGNDNQGGKDDDGDGDERSNSLPW